MFGSTADQGIIHCLSESSRDGVVPRSFDSEFWRPVRDSNFDSSGDNAMSEAIYCNSTELSGMDSTLPHLKDSACTLIGVLVDSYFSASLRLTNTEFVSQPCRSAKAIA